jgi:hypothetical protein
MRRFLIEQLPRTPASYLITPLSFEGWRTWMEQSSFDSLVQTAEMIDAIEAALNMPLVPSDAVLHLKPGDEAVLVTLSFGVLLAWAEGKIAPLPEDWRCLTLTVSSPESGSPLILEAAVVDSEIIEGDADAELTGPDA